MMTLPKVVRAEVKFTTGTSVQVPLREREALISHEDDTIGIIATLFWCGDRSIDGQWLIADINELFGSIIASSVTLSKNEIRRAMMTQPWLEGLNEHLERYWPPFLHAFLDSALLGHNELLKELIQCHKESVLKTSLPDYVILETDHRDAVITIIEHHGTSVAGHIFQDLFAYLLGLAGYHTVRINPVGVPDIEVSDFSE